MEVRVWDESSLDAYGLYSNGKMGFAVVDGGDELLFVADRDVRFRLVDDQRLVGSGFIERNQSFFDVSWEILRPDVHNIESITKLVSGTVGDFFRNLHKAETHRPQAPASYQPLQLLLHQQKPLYRFDNLPDATVLRPAPSPNVLHETIRPCAPTYGKIEGITITPDGEVIASELLEVAISSLVQSAPDLKELYDNGHETEARLAALCKPLFVNVLRKVSVLNFKPFEKIKRRLGE